MGRLERLKNDPTQPEDAYTPNRITSRLNEKAFEDRAAKIHSALSSYGPSQPKESVRSSYDVNQASQADMKKLLKNF